MSMYKVDNPTSLCQVLEKLYIGKEHSDVTFVVENQKIQAHRIILASQSEFFEKLLFNNEFKEGELSEIPIEAPLEAFQLLVQFMYTRKLELKKYEEKGGVYSELLDLSRKFGVQSLEKVVVQYFVSSINYNNVFELLNLAFLYESDLLRDECFTALRNIGQGIFQNQKIAEISHDLLKKIISSSLVKATIWKFYAVQKWLDQNTECAEADKKALIELIDVKKLSNRQIIQILGPSNLYKRSELFKILEQRVADVCEEPEDLESYNYSIIVGGKYTSDKNRTLSSEVNSTHTVILKLRSLAYCVSILTYHVKPYVSVCKDFEGTWFSIGNSNEIPKFGSSDRPFNIVKVTHHTYAFQVHGVKLGLVKGMSQEQLIEAKLVEQ